MNSELITATVLFGPAAIVGPVCLIGHRITRRHDETVASVVAGFRPTETTEPEPPPKGRIKAPRQTAPAPVATVIDFAARRRDAA
ncbi:hypothetical protein [Streptomyces sp. CA-251247]|uniref:hypothetical protein n=1 Tax=Streptomyces sp. CA-251247 TaxID=3240062 RepID=UPI003D8DF1E2